MRADAVYADASGAKVEAVALWDEGLPTPLNINPKTGEFASCKEARVAAQRVFVCPKPDGAHHSAIIWVRPGAQFTVAIYKPSSVPEKAAAELVLKVATPLVAASVTQFP